MSEATAITERKEFNYYAFISYSRKDEEWANWLQKKLETYRLPAALRQENGDLPKKIFPIFRDKTDLSGVDLEESLCRELEASKYLIVICSKNSAASEWVDKEVAYFLSLGRENSIIPFVIDDAGIDGGEGCYPPALRQRKDSLLAVSMAELGKRNAFLRVVSTLLELRYDQVVMRDAKRRRAQRGCLISVCAMVVAMAGGVIWYNVPHHNYYSSYTYHYEIPQGIGKLTKKQREGLYSSYRITTQRGRVVRMACVNSAGVVVEPVVDIATTDYPVQDFLYDEKGTLITVEQCDINERVQGYKILTHYLQRNQIAVEFRQPSNHIQIMAMGADVSYMVGMDRDSFKRSEITRMLNTYDEQGLMISSIYQRDNLGNPTCDKNGVYGKRYEYDAQGQIHYMYNLDAQGQIHDGQSGWAVVEYEYDEQGRYTREQYYDSTMTRVKNEQGRWAEQIFYDERGNMVRMESLDEQGQLCVDETGCAIQTAEYTDEGYVCTTRKWDAQGDPVNNADDVCETQIRHDAQGRILQISFYDVDKQPVCSRESGYASYVNVLDASGRIVEQRYYGVDGEPIRDLKTGAYGYCREFDENGYTVAEYSLDGEGNYAMNQDGYACRKFVWNPQGQCVRVEFRDPQGSFVRCTQGYAVALFSYDVFGNTTCVQCLDEEETPCNNAKGYSCLEMGTENGRVVTMKYLDAQGDPIAVDGLIAQYQIDHDEQGNQVSLLCFDVNGNCRIRENYRYDSYGRMQWMEEIRWENGQQIRTERQYDVRGNVTKTWYYDGAGILEKVDVPMILVQRVDAGSAAERAGIQKADILMQYDDWDFFAEDHGDSMIFDWKLTVRNAANRNKRLVVCRLEEDELRFYSVDFPEGTTGIHWTTLDIEAHLSDWLGENYRQWQKSNR